MHLNQYVPVYETTNMRCISNIMYIKLLANLALYIHGSADIVVVLLLYIMDFTVFLRRFVCNIHFVETSVLFSVPLPIFQNRISCCLWVSSSAYCLIEIERNHSPCNINKFDTYDECYWMYNFHKKNNFKRADFHILVYESWKKDFFHHLHWVPANIS